MFDIIKAILQMALTTAWAIVALTTAVIACLLGKTPGNYTPTPEFPNWEVSQEFLSKFMSGAYHPINRVLYVQLLDENGLEIPSSSTYTKGGKPVMGVVVAGGGIGIEPEEVVWHAVATPLVVHSIKIIDPKEKLDIMGTDFPKPCVIDVGNEFRILQSPKGLFSI